MKKLLIVALLGLFTAHCMEAAPVIKAADPVTELAIAYQEDMHHNLLTNEGTTMVVVFEQTTVPVLRQYAPAVCLSELQHFYRPIVYEFSATPISVIVVEDNNYYIKGSCRVGLLLDLCRYDKG